MAIEAGIVLESIRRSRLVLKDARTEIHVGTQLDERRFDRSLASSHRPRIGTSSW